MKQQKQNKTIDSYLSSIIEESLKSTLQRRALEEKEKQDATSSGSSEVAADKGDKEIEKLKKGNIAVDDVVEKLNSIRSGKSFKDDAIYSSLEKYFNDLKDNEKIALLAFLKGIAQIVTGEIQGPKAIDPGDNPAGIEMKKTSGHQKVSIKPNVIKAPDIKKSEKPSKEDTSGPVPIKPKK